MSLHAKKSTGWLVALALVASVASARVRVGQKFPDLSGFGLEGVLPDQAGRVVLVDFWASWCGPCKASFPEYSKLQHELAERGFTLIAVSVDRRRNAYADFVGRFSPTFATVRDGSQKFATELMVPAMPTSYLIDRHGILRSVRSGFNDKETMRELRREIIQLTEEKS